VTLGAAFPLAEKEKAAERPPVPKKLTVKQRKAAEKLAKNTRDKLTAKQQKASQKPAAKVKPLLECGCGFTG
jgi:hypothetical protein